MITAIENKKLVIKHQTGIIDIYTVKELEKIKTDLMISQIQAQIEYDKINAWISQIKG